MARTNFLVVAVASIVFAASCSSGAGDDDALKDGLVTAAEYRSAVEATTRCVEEAGFSTTKIRPAINPIMLEFGVNMTDDSEMDASSQAMDSCREKNLAEIEKAYFFENVPTGAERDALFDELLGCMSDVGVSGISRASSEEEIVMAISTQYANDMGPGLLCLEEYRVVFPEGMYGG